ncbi:MAG: hypothetical protein JSS30_07090 [Verrucomicrobia bacterium]|nr:hypothetical protein [Verrucomicrobiota bacterium]
MSLKSERLKKLENELTDLEQWLKLGLVPKKDLTKHSEEIESVKKKISEELERLRFLKESGEVEEYVPPKRGARASYQEPQSMPDVTMSDETATEGEATGFESDTESFDTETVTGEESTEENTKEEEVSSQIYEDDEDPFSDKNRWRRGILHDPDADEW